MVDKTSFRSPLLSSVYPPTPMVAAASAVAPSLRRLPGTVPANYRYITCCHTILVLTPTPGDPGITPVTQVSSKNISCLYGVGNISSVHSAKNISLYLSRQITVE